MAVAVTTCTSKGADSNQSFFVATRHSHRCYSGFLNLAASPECVYVTLDTPHHSQELTLKYSGENWNYTIMQGL